VRQCTPCHVGDASLTRSKGLVGVLRCPPCTASRTLPFALPVGVRRGEDRSFSFLLLLSYLLRWWVSACLNKVKKNRQSKGVSLSFSHFLISHSFPFLFLFVFCSGFAVLCNDGSGCTTIEQHNDLGACRETGAGTFILCISLYSLFQHFFCLLLQCLRSWQARPLHGGPRLPM
jgi:hypothetical protein